MTNVPRSIREISVDLTGTHPIPLKAGGNSTALEIQRAYLTATEAFLAAKPQMRMPSDDAVLDLWRRAIDAVATGDISGICTEIDWAIKLRLIRQYQQRGGLDLDDPRILRLDLAYHDISAQRSVFSALEAKGAIVRLTAPAAVEAAKSTAPQTTRAKLRGAFMQAAVAAGKDVTTDWVHLKINDAIGKTVQLKDPFESSNARVDYLIEYLSQQ